MLLPPPPSMLPLSCVNCPRSRRCRCRSRPRGQPGPPPWTPPPEDYEQVDAPVPDAPLDRREAAKVTWCSSPLLMCRSCLLVLLTRSRCRRPRPSWPCDGIHRVVERVSLQAAECRQRSGCPGPLLPVLHPVMVQVCEPRADETSGVGVPIPPVRVRAWVKSHEVSSVSELCATSR